MVHFDALVNRMGALLEFFDLGQIFMNELKHDLTVFKAEAEKVSSPASVFSTWAHLSF